jgi:uncharacterized GH25 family protein
MRSATLKTAVLLAVMPALASTAAGAADLWIQTEPAAPSPGEEVAIRIYRGEPFAGEELTYGETGATLFQHLWRKGRLNLAGSGEGSPAARFNVEDAGVHLVVLNSGGGTSYCKALVVAGAARTDDPVRYSEFGQRLEIVPQNDPVELARRGGRLEVQVLFEREPLALARVVAIPAEEPQAGLEAAITDEIGLATLNLDRPGWWLLRVRHTPREPGADRTPLSSTLALAAGG